MTLSDQRDFQWYGTSHGLSATAELLDLKTFSLLEMDLEWWLYARFGMPHPFQMPIFALYISKRPPQDWITSDLSAITRTAITTSEPVFVLSYFVENSKHEIIGNNCLFHKTVSYFCAINLHEFAWLSRSQRVLKTRMIIYRLPAFSVLPSPVI